MKRYARIATACVVIVALTVDSVTACWFFARRIHCRPCSPRCYSAPVIYSSCGPAGPASPHDDWQSYPPSRNGMMPQAPSRGAPPMPAAPSGADRSRLAPADRDREPSPSDRDEAAPLQPLPDRETAPGETEPMPEPPADSTQPAPNPFDNPFSQPRDTQPPAAAERAQPAIDDAQPAAEETAPALDNQAPPAPGVTEPDNPFAPRPSATETTPPAETTPAPAGDNPFAPRDSAATAPADESNPFAPRTGATDTPGATESSNAEPPTDNPFAPPPANAGSTPDDPFRLPGDAPKPPMSEVNEAPTNDAPASSKTDADEAATEPASAEPMSEPALDNPFGEPAPERLSTTKRAPEPADAMRIWTDITGKHRVRGQMKKILVAQQKVRILKETGKYTTVPFDKLSETDRTFVARHAIEPSTLLAETR